MPKKQMSFDLSEPDTLQTAVLIQNLRVIYHAALQKYTIKLIPKQHIFQ